MVDLVRESLNGEIPEADIAAIVIVTILEETRDYEHQKITFISGSEIRKTSYNLKKFIIEHFSTQKLVRNKN